MSELQELLDQIKATEAHLASLRKEYREKKHCWSTCCY